MSFIRTHDESFCKYTDSRQGKVIIDWYIGILKREDIAEMSFDFEVVADRTDHEEFSSIGPDQDLGLVKPGVGCEVSGFG